MLIAATKSDESNNIDQLNWSVIVTKLLPHKKQINGNIIIECCSTWPAEREVKLTAT